MVYYGLSGKSESGGERLLLSSLQAGRLFEAGRLIE